MTFARSLLLLLVACTWSPASGSVPHHGCYLDKNHYAGPTSWAGLRFIAEGPPHTLKMVGSDDGVKWWTLVGTCSGSKMEKITFDFSSKGGPAALVGTAKVLADGTAQVSHTPRGSRAASSCELRRSLTAKPPTRVVAFRVSMHSDHLAGWQRMDSPRVAAAASHRHIAARRGRGAPQLVGDAGMGGGAGRDDSGGRLCGAPLPTAWHRVHTQRAAGRGIGT